MIRHGWTFKLSQREVKQTQESDYIYSLQDQEEKDEEDSEEEEAQEAPGGGDSSSDDEEEEKPKPVKKKKLKLPKMFPPELVDIIELCGNKEVGEDVNELVKEG